MQNSANLNVQAPAVQAPIMHPINQTTRYSRCHFSLKFAQTLFISPFTSTALLICRVVKLITWDIGKAATFKILGYHVAAGTFLQDEYLKTVRVARDILFIPTVARSAFNDMVSKREKFEDDLKMDDSQRYLSSAHTKKSDQFSSYMYGTKTFEVIKPSAIQEFAAESDGTLNTVMASHFLKPGVMAINFGIPNVAAFTTEDKGDGSVQTVKVDAKSLKREPMKYHATNGKIQSGVFFVPTNIPAEALKRFNEAAKKMEGRADITCVNTNCRVLQQAGFSIEGKKMEDVIFPNTFMEHLLFRNVIYTDTEGKKHKVHFDIINTTPNSLEDHFEKIDMAVVGTRLRHRQRNADTEESRKARGVAAKALIESEKRRLESERKGLASESEHKQDAANLTRRKFTVSVPSFIGSAVASIWGRHTIFEVHLADKKEQIAERFKKESLPKLKPFPQAKPSFTTKVKRDILFSKPMINFLRRHMMGNVDTLYLNTQDLFSHLKSTEGERLNYVIFEDKAVFARVNANGKKEEALRKTADWALSKHALLAGREDVLCSGELWYDKARGRFMMNKDSGTYMPHENHLKVTVELANEIFEANGFEATEAAA